MDVTPTDAVHIDTQHASVHAAAIRSAQALLPTRHGPFKMIAYDGPGGKENVALVVGQIDDGAPVLVRLHSECMTGDLFGSSRCDCGEQLQASLALLQAEQRGVLVYLRQEGRGIGLTNKLRAYALQDCGYDTLEANELLGFPADMRTYEEAALILADLGVSKVRLLTNNPTKVAALNCLGIEVVEQIPLLVDPNPHNLGYLRTKQEKMGHLLSLTTTDD
jgi:GTP cyclohydrolase II